MSIREKTGDRERGRWMESKRATGRKREGVRDRRTEVQIRGREQAMEIGRWRERERGRALN